MYVVLGIFIPGPMHVLHSKSCLAVMSVLPAWKFTAFGITSSILAGSTPIHSANPCHTPSQGVVGMRPAHRRQATRSARDAGIRTRYLRW
jgi:hypothetical protein|eukprot:SAG25_NODE_2_length_31535_cov_18.197322_14_plen_90_part_00